MWAVHFYQILNLTWIIPFIPVGSQCSQDDGARRDETTSAAQEHDGIDTGTSAGKPLLHLNPKYHTRRSRPHAGEWWSFTGWWRITESCGVWISRNHSQPMDSKWIIVHQTSVALFVLSIEIHCHRSSHFEGTLCDCISFTIWLLLFISGYIILSTA